MYSTLFVQRGLWIFSFKELKVTQRSWLILLELFMNINIQELNIEKHHVDLRLHEDIHSKVSVWTVPRYSAFVKYVNA